MAAANVTALLWQARIDFCIMIALCKGVSSGMHFTRARLPLAWVVCTGCRRVQGGVQRHHVGELYLENIMNIPVAVFAIEFRQRTEVCGHPGIR